MSVLGSRKISEIMDRKVVAISPSATVKSATKLIRTSGVSLLVVVEKEKLIGILTEDEILNRAPEESIKALVKRPIFVEANDTISVAIGKTIDNNLTRIPIVDSMQNMKCVGVITATELLKEAAKESK